MSDSKDETAVVKSFCKFTQTQVYVTMQVVSRQRRFELVTGIPIDCNRSNCTMRKEISCVLHRIRMTTADEKK